MYFERINNMAKYAANELTTVHVTKYGVAIALYIRQIAQSTNNNNY